MDASPPDDVVRILDSVNERHNSTWMLLGRLPGGYQQGAYQLVGGDATRAVLKWHPRHLPAAQLRSAAMVIEQARSRGWPTPRWIASGSLPDGGAYIVEELIRGAPPDESRWHRARPPARRDRAPTRCPAGDRAGLVDVHPARRLRRRGWADGTYASAPSDGGVTASARATDVRRTRYTAPDRRPGSRRLRVEQHAPARRRGLCCRRCPCGKGHPRVRPRDTAHGNSGRRRLQTSLATGSATDRGDLPGDRGTTGVSRVRSLSDHASAGVGRSSLDGGCTPNLRAVPCFPG